MKKYLLMMLLSFGIFAEDTNITTETAISPTEQGIIIDESSSSSDSFGSDSFIDESDTSSTIEEITSDLLKESTTLTGDLKMSADYSNYDETPVTGDFASTISSNLNLDVRLTDGVKAYTSFKLTKSNIATTDSFIKLNEMFFDFNVKNKTYIRVGKQNLAWGRGYFFNPTDLINIASKDLNDVSGTREGNYGIKIHVPQGVSKNFYTYIKMENSENIKDLTLALKYEFLVKNSEFSVSTVFRDPSIYDPVLAFDFGSSWGKAQTFGELTFQNGDKLDYYENGINVSLKDKLIVKATLGYNRTFDRKPKEEEKTLQLTQEVYYNGAGYPKNGKDGFPVSTGSGSPKYNPYKDGQYFLANFITLNKIINKDGSLTLNSLSNLSDNIHQISGTFNYEMNDEVTLGTSLTGYLGEQGALASSIPNYTLGVSAEVSF